MPFSSVLRTVLLLMRRAALTAPFVAALLPAAALAGTSNPAPVTTPYQPAFDPAQFGGPIDNPWHPLKPGTVYRHRGVGDDGKSRELNTVRVTHRKKRIMGVEATVVLDQVFSEGKPEERTFDWYAQDNAGNVWYLGEDSFDFEHGRFVKSDGSWEAGKGDGKPGVIMLAHPRRGDAYRQEYSPGNAVDQAQVLGGGGAVRVPLRTFKRTLLTLEYSSIDKQYELKWYARGVGVIKAQAVTKSKELSRLVAIKR
jgi:hypothetical protein